MSFTIKTLSLLLFIAICLSSCNNKSEDEITPEHPGKNIQETFPANNSSDIDWNVVPHIKLIHAIDKNINQSNNIYKYELEHVNLFVNNVAIESDLQWNEFNTELIITPKTYFKSNSTIKLEARFVWKVLKDGEWVTPDNSFYEDVNLSFNTSELSNTIIEPDNIDYQYPYANQYHYLQKEYDKGFLKTFAPQDDLFDKGAITARISNKGGFLFESEATYNALSFMLVWQMPNNLDNESIYKVELIQNNNTIYSYHFRTSLFNIFAEKAATMVYSSSWINPFSQNAWNIGANFGEQAELYDIPECIPLKGLIRFELDKTTEYYSRYLYPFLYEHQSKFPEISRNFNDPYYNYSPINYQLAEEYSVNLENSVSIPPLNAMVIDQMPAPLLSKSQISEGKAERFEKEYAGYTITSLFHQIATQDFLTLRAWILDNESKTANTESWKKEIKETDFIASPSQGIYSFSMNYTLPNGTITSSEKLNISLNIGPDIEDIALD